MVGMCSGARRSGLQHRTLQQVGKGDGGGILLLATALFHACSPPIMTHQALTSPRVRLFTFFNSATKTGLRTGLLFLVNMRGMSTSTPNPYRKLNVDLHTRGPG